MIICPNLFFSFFGSMDVWLSPAPMSSLHCVFSATFLFFVFLASAVCLQFHNQEKFSFASPPETSSCYCHASGEASVLRFYNWIAIFFHFLQCRQRKVELVPFLNIQLDRSPFHIRRARNIEFLHPFCNREVRLSLNICSWF